jgi:NAD dependent epimerase/dehydratase family enzyme
MHLILTGATGLVGTAVLDAMIRTKDITKISVLSRRPVKFTDDRINVILHKDFASYDGDLLAKLQGAQACVWALGISQSEVSKESVTLFQFGSSKSRPTHSLMLGITSQ